MDEQKEKEKKHLLAILLEDYFQVGAFGGFIRPQQWYRFESRFERNTLAALDLLDRFGAGATFFVLDWIAEKCPELVKEIVQRGQEVACYSYLEADRFSSAQLCEELKRLREMLAQASGIEVCGFRSAYRWNWKQSYRALEVLAESGFSYDASILPTLWDMGSAGQQRFAGEVNLGRHQIWEFPVSTWKVGSFLLPVAGGNYFRQLPHTLVKRAVAHWHKSYDAPFVMYFHVWELDPAQPRISSASLLAKIRHYRNLDKMSWVIEDYLGKYSFAGFAQYLNYYAEVRGTVREPKEHIPSTTAHSIVESVAPQVDTSTLIINPAEKVPVSIVIPCFNEEQTLPYLGNTLRSVRRELGGDYEVRFIFVDDASRDRTWNVLGSLFGGDAHCTLLRHRENQGVAAAIMTGIKHAETNVVCSMDCDCTYDPHELRRMIPLLKEGISLVTASPYHPQGKVLNVPSWRLLLSKTSSLLYRLVLRQKLATYTSCFRVYRRNDVADLSLDEGGFLGIAELLGRLDLQGRRVVEYPATLEVRLFGYSKMKLAKTIFGHLRLLFRLLAARIAQSRSARKEFTARESSCQPTPDGTSQ